MISPIVTLIPAYRPSVELADLITKLLAAGLDKIVLVDDGSPSTDGPIFTEVRQMLGVSYLRHDSNLGKGAALKTGLRFIHNHFPAALGIVTADADGQHMVGDIAKVAQSIIDHPGQLILGVRSFAGSLPWRSWFGNTLTRKIFYWITGQQISDTQTGLRGLPASWLPWLTNLSGDQYEYEINMLLETKRRGLSIMEEPIATIYETGNHSSHFHPIVDSFKIYRSLLRYRHQSASKIIVIPPDYLKSIATVSDRMPKLYYHPIGMARNFFWSRLATLTELADHYVGNRNQCLDFACGSGIFLPTLSRLFREVVGIDLEMTEARELLAHYQLSNVRLIEADINLVQLGGQFDAIFAADVLEHFSNLSLPVAKIQQWLATDGVLLTSLPTENVFTRLTRLVGGYQKPWDHYHTGSEVEKFLANHGFSRITRRLVTPWFPLYYLAVWRRD